MGAVTRNLIQLVTYWKSIPNGYGGYSFTGPFSAMARWEDDAVLFRDPRGEEQTSSSVVYIDRPLEVDDYLYLGESLSASPLGLAGAHQVRQFFKTPDLRNHETEYKALL